MRPALAGALLLLLAALPLLPLEYAVRLWVARAGDPLDRALVLLRPDGRLGWRQREGWRGFFYGSRVELDAQGLRNPPAAARPRVLLLGPSSTFGWGVAEEETYARRLERAASVPVLNAGQIGYTSWQGLRFLREDLAGLAPEVIVLAYGVNDVDRFRFMGGDERPDRLALAGERGAALDRLLARSALSRRLRRGMAALRYRTSCAVPVPGLRVPPEDFAANIAMLVAEVRRRGARPLLLTSAFSYRASAADAERCDRESARAARLAGEGRCAEARATFERSRALEPARLARDLRAYNQALRVLARRERVELVDAEALLAPAKLLDPVHPTAAGHDILARAVAERLVARKMLDSAHARR